MRLIRSIISVSLFCIGVQFLSAQGPAQPEFTGFKPIGATDMVNTFTGDINYSIPLLDIEGFPINLNNLGYVTNTEDASWAGLGWGINIGAINRQMRGLPDEFNGTDKAVKAFNIRKNVTTGVNLNTNLQLFNWQPFKRKGASGKKEKDTTVGLKLSLGLGLGIFYNNYNGWGHEFSISPSFSLSKASTGSLNAGLNLKSSSQSGMDVTPNLGISMLKDHADKSQSNIGLTIGAPINSREGLKAINFGISYTNKTTTKETVTNSDGTTKEVTKTRTNASGKGSSSISFASPSYSPTISMPMANRMYALSINGHGDIFGIDGGGSIMGHLSIHKLEKNSTENPLYGYLNAELGKDDEFAVHDFNREKEVPYHENVPVIAVPNHTYDLFSVNQPDASGQFRAFRTSSGVLFDSKATNYTASSNLGFEIGGGNILQVGVTLNATRGNTTTKKWGGNNPYLFFGDFRGVDNDVNKVGEKFYFKNTGEFISTDMNLWNKYGQNKAFAVSLAGSGRSTYPSNIFTDKNNHPFVIGSELSSIADVSSGKYTRDNERTTSLTYLTKKERKVFGVEKAIKSYSGFGNLCNNFTPYENPNSKDHHISEITVVNADGRRCIYGIPVYNNYQKEVTFAISGNQPDANGLVSYSSNDASTANGKGLDNYYNSETMPAYPTTWLLTSIHSQDYQDVTGDGISDDDLGTAYKFNYSLKNADFKWRNPATKEQKANFNIGLQENPDDDKASYVFGSREEWYIHSIESKNMIAYFYISPRNDAYGIKEHGGIDNASVKFKLDSIRLFTKAELNMRGIAKAVPIKVVNLQYDPSYSLCQGIENNINSNSGKLTLDKLFFTYGESKRSMFNAYSFKYNNASYKLKNSDRWGNYKLESENRAGMSTSDYPYTNQDTSKSNKYAKAWLLSEVTLPSGSKINFNYEADDYAFVQNKRASYLAEIVGVGNNATTPTSDLYGTSSFGVFSINTPYRYVFFKFDNNAKPTTVQEMREWYFNDPNNLDYTKNLYFRAKVDIFSGGEKEFIPGYMEVEDMGIKDANTGWVKVKLIEGFNPIAFSAWQLAKSQMPKRAYPWSNIGDDLGPLAFILAIPTFYNNLREMKKGYGSMASEYKLARGFDPAKSALRLLKPDNTKIGGGYRVKRVTINDNWNSMTATGSSSNYKNSIYGSEYSYKKLVNGKYVSSGVAEYEPILGGDENSFRSPIHYSGPKALFAPTSTHFVEEPVCEGFFPSPSVGYSYVEVKSINSPNDPKAIHGTGKQIYEYYTAKEFPTYSERTNLGDNTERYNPNFFSSFLKIENRTGLYLSQGFSVETNDMHGKPKSEKVFNQEGIMTSETVTSYRLDDKVKNKMAINSYLPTIDESGQINSKMKGVSFDLYTDMRHQSTKTYQLDAELGGGFFLIGIFPIPHFSPFPPFGVIENDFYSSSTMKYVHKKAFVDKVYKMKDGSSIVTENLLWDDKTGDVLVTKTTNEYDEPIYSLKYPAYWKYKDMDFSYKNMGMYFSDKIDNGRITSSNKMRPYVFVGDELIFIDKNNKSQNVWVIDNPNTQSDLYLIDRMGVKLNDSGFFRIIRTGRKNLSNLPMFESSMLKNPIVGNTVSINTSNRILSASGSSYSDKWKIIKNSPAGKISGCYNQPLEKRMLEVESNAVLNDMRFKQKITEWFNCPLLFLEPVTKEN